MSFLLRPFPAVAPTVSPVVVSPTQAMTGAGAFDAYAVLNKSPALVAAFADDYYRANKHSKPLSEVVTHSRAGNATMVDSDGLIKWAPHNLFTYSEDFSNAAWSKNASSVTSNTIVAPDGTLTGDKLIPNSGNNLYAYASQSYPTDNAGRTFSIFLKKGELRYVCFRGANPSSFTNQFAVDLEDGSITYNNGSSENTVTHVGNSWYRITCNADVGTFGGAVVAVVPTSSPVTSFTDSSGTRVNGDGYSGIYIWGASLYRSNLGGMVDVPAGERVIPSASTYVPTTSSARYLPRVGHHVYNGSAWVNEGVLAESEPRTNLITYSSEFDNAAWNLGGAATLTLNQETGPDGALSMARLQLPDGFGAYLWSNSYTVPSAATYTGSIWIKGAAGTTVRLGFLSAPVALTTGTLHTCSGELERVYVSQQLSAGQTYWLALDNDSPNTSDVYIYGAQFEAGPTPSSYIPTAGSTVTRVAETFTIPAANLPWPTETYGPELVTNGTFDTDVSGWSAEVNASIALSSNALEVTETTGTTNVFSFAYQDITTVAGKTYVVSFDLVSTTDIAGVYAVRGTSNNVAANDGLSGFQSASGTYTFTFTATVSGHRIALRTQNANSVSVFDNISVRELTRYPVSIQMNGRMTYADNNLPSDVAVGTAEAILTRWLASSTNYIGQAFSTNTGTGKFNFEQMAAGTLDFVISDANTLTPGILVPFNIAGRHGMTFVNGAVDGVALTANTTPTNLPDLSATDLSLAYDYMGTVETFRMWGVDLADAGIALAATTAPSIYGLPTISGEINDPEVGETLAAVSAPVVLGAPTPSTTWQWLRDGLVILGATSSSYVLTNDDLGSKISVKQTITNVGGSAFSTSAETATVTGIPATATQQRDGAYIFDRANSYIEVRA